MSICSTACQQVVPSITLTDCTPQTRVGAIGYIGIFVCDFAFNKTVDPGAVVIGAITDPVSWTDALTNNLLLISPNLGAAKPATSQTIEELPCVGDVVVAERHTLTVDSIEAPSDFSDYTFWQAMRDDARSYRMAYFDCCGNLYGSNCDADAPFFEFQSNVQPISAKTNREPLRWQGDISWDYNGIPTVYELDATVKDALGFACTTC